jgi:DNA-binding MarR family transcriptional regulator
MGGVKEMAKFRATFSNQELLDYIQHNPGCSTNDLVERFKVTRQDIQHRTKRLAKKGFLLVDVGHGRRPSCFHVTNNRRWRSGKRDAY